MKHEVVVADARDVLQGFQDVEGEVAAGVLYDIQKLIKVHPVRVVW